MGLDGEDRTLGVFRGIDFLRELEMSYVPELKVRLYCGAVIQLSMLQEQHYAAALIKLKLYTEEVLMRCPQAKKKFMLHRKKELKFYF